MRHAQVEVTGRRDLEHLGGGPPRRRGVDVLQGVRQRTGGARLQRPAADRAREIERALRMFDGGVFVAGRQPVDRRGAEQERLGAGVAASRRRPRRRPEHAVGAFGERTAGCLRPDPAQARVLRRVADDRRCRARASVAARVRGRRSGPRPTPRSRAATRSRDASSMPGSSTARNASWAQRAPSVESDRRGPQASRAAVSTSPRIDRDGRTPRARRRTRPRAAPAASSRRGRARARRARRPRSAKYAHVPFARDIRASAASSRASSERAHRLEQPEAPAGAAGRALHERLVDELREPVGGRRRRRTPATAAAAARSNGAAERAQQRAAASARRRRAAGTTSRSRRRARGGARAVVAAGRPTPTSPRRAVRGSAPPRTRACGPPRARARAGCRRGGGTARRPLEVVDRPRRPARPGRRTSRTASDVALLVGRRRLVGQIERRDDEHLLAGDAEGLAARREDAHLWRLAVDAADDLGDGVDAPARSCRRRAAPSAISSVSTMRSQSATSLAR